MLRMYITIEKAINASNLFIKCRMSTTKSLEGKKRYQHQQNLATNHQACTTAHRTRILHELNVKTFAYPIWITPSLALQINWWSVSDAFSANLFEIITHICVVTMINFCLHRRYWKVFASSISHCFVQKQLQKNRCELACLCACVFAC